jgi:hypothetical protein
MKILVVCSAQAWRIKEVLSTLKNNCITLLTTPSQRIEWRDYPCIEIQNTGESLVEELKRRNFDLVVLPYRNNYGIGYEKIERFVASFAKKVMIIDPEGRSKVCEGKQIGRLSDRDRAKILMDTLHSKSDRGFITTIFTAGLCNRLYTWVLLRNLADYYEMNIVLDWEELKDKILHLPITYHLDFCRPSKEVYKLFTPICAYSIRCPSELNLDPRRDYVVLGGFYHSPALANKNRKKLVNEVKFNSSYEAYVDLFLSEFSGQPVVGLHIRRGDYRLTDRFIIGSPYRIPDSWYLDIARQFLKRFPEVKFFLATDGTDEEKRIFLENLPIISISTNSKLHRQDILELLTLTKLPVIIASCSTFSSFALEYGRNKVGIHPKYLNQQIDKELSSIGEEIYLRSNHNQSFISISN